jgi:outer membrane protein insertion porin family
VTLRRGASLIRSASQIALRFVLLGLVATPSFAAPYFGKNVTSVDVQGLKRIEKEAVLAKLSSRVGEAVTRETARADIQALFNLGYFDDIEIHGEASGSGVKLVYKVKERPVIARIEFDGNERISTSDLQEVIKVKEWSILDINKVREDTTLIQKHYEDKGFYLAKVTYSLEVAKDDEIVLTYRINDYDKVTIKKITFLNNKVFTDSQLKAVLGETREGGLFSFLSGSGSFKESSFKLDLQRLQYWYLEHGYVKFQFENPVVTVSEDKRDLFITIYVNEGEQYKMGRIDFAGDLLFTKEELYSELSLKSGDVFAITRRNMDIQRLTEKYQDLGYAFTNVIPKMDVRDDTREVDFNYVFEKGSLVYIGEVNILGNTKTLDKVVRRELQVFEGELYSGSRLRESKENVERLGYFAPGEVVFNQVSPPGKPDVVDIEITVKERSTGTITLGAGFGSIQQFFFTTQISEINLFGRGQTVSLMAQIATGNNAKSFNFSFTDPYAFDTRWTMGGDLFYVLLPIFQKYDTRKFGTNLRVGRPLFQYANVFITYKLEDLTIENSIDPAVLDPLDVEADDGLLSSVVVSFLRDKRNNRFETTGGDFQSASLEFAGLGGEKQFVKAVLNARYYQRLFGDFVFRTSVEVGHMFGFGSERTPPSERFFLGGPNNMRGFTPFGVGPYRERARSSSDPTLVREPTGAEIEMFGLFEVEHPIIREAGIKGVVFFDVGNGFSGWPIRNFELRTCAGLGIRWFSPIGPLRFEWGFPLDRKPGEDASQFQFFIGPPF